MYHGEQSQLLPYFSSLGLDCEEFDNPADFLLDVVILNEPAVGTEQSMQSPEDPQQRMFDLASSFKDKKQLDEDDGSVEGIFVALPGMKLGILSKTEMDAVIREIS